MSKTTHSQTLSNIYTDIDLTFNMKPVSKDIALSVDEQSVIRSVRGLCSTNFYDRLMQPNIGGNITTLLFEPLSSITASALQIEIAAVINNYEPRALVQTIQAIPIEDQNAYYVIISFFIGNSTQSSTVNLIMQRTR